MLPDYTNSAPGVRSGARAVTHALRDRVTKVRVAPAEAGARAAVAQLSCAITGVVEPVASVICVCDNSGSAGTVPSALSGLTLLKTTTN